MKFVLQQNVWQGFEPVEIDLPDDWDVEYHGIAADDMPALTREEIRARIDAPCGSAPLRELARGRERVAIVFDDISRATPTKILAEIVLEELHAAGIRKEQIRFICALGTHGALDRNDFVCKLGENIVRQYRVFNHNCYENCVCIGKTKRGFDVCINKEFMSCDLRIGLGAILPHVFNTFGGGGKILFPGLASIDTVEQNHNAALGFCHEHDLIPAQVMGDMRVDGMRREVEEMTRMVGQFFKIDCLYNTRFEIVGLFAGDPIEEYYAAIPMAKKIYVTPRSKDKQIVIVNANARANESTIAMTVGLMLVSGFPINEKNY
jgi:nickel-dependent lactate racemase